MAKDRIPNEKVFLHEKILEIMKEATPDKPIQKKRIIEILENRYGIHIARGTLDSKFADLEEKGYKLTQVGKGFILENTEMQLSDGELRMIADSILYSGVVSSSYAADIIGRLGEMASPEVAKVFEKRAKSAKLLGRSGDYNIIIFIESIQKAIAEGKQVSCNVIEYDRFFEPVRKYDDNVVVNPYELAFSGGRYYLVCALDGGDELTMLRVDRLVDVEMLNSTSKEIPQIKKIRNDKGMEQYIYSQPELKGGQKERFTLLCYRDSLNDVYDAFDGDLRIRNDIEENYDDPDTVRVSVETTHDAMVAWAVMHADSVVVTFPQSVHDEIVQALKAAEHTYFKTGKPSFVRAWTALSIDEALREVRNAGRKMVHYTGHGKKKELEKLDLGKVDFSGMNTVSLWTCDISESKIEGVFADVRKLSLIRGKFSMDIFEHFPNLKSITISYSDIDNLDFLKLYSKLREVKIFECDNISDFTPLFALEELKRFETGNINFTEEISSKLIEKFPDCIVEIVVPPYRSK